MEWRKFEDKERNNYIRFIKKSCINLFGQLDQVEQSIFYHYWYKILNEHICYALYESNKIVGFISKPEWQPKHWSRWPECFALVGEKDISSLELPSEFEEIDSFRTLNLEKNISQFAYALNLDDFDLQEIENLNHDLDFHEIKNKKLDLIENLLDKDERDSDVPAGFYEEYYLPDLVNKIKSNFKENYGIGFYATLKGEDEPIAVAFYEGYEMPFTGTPCMLIYDIVVKSEFRRRRVATSLQAFSYNELKKKNVRWIFGSIAANNKSSLKQAEALNRQVWAGMTGA